MKCFSALLAGIALLISTVGCCCHNRCRSRDMCQPMCPPAYPACPPCPGGACDPGVMPYGSDPFAPTVQPQGYYGTYNVTPGAPVMAVGPAVPQTSMADSLPTYH